MVRERRRLLIPPSRLEERIPLTAPERHYLQRVLRLGAGQGCDVVDGAGHRWGARLMAEGLLALEQPLIAPLEAQKAPTPLLELAVALPRQEVEVVWRMATELGLDRLQPLRAERCQGREHWPLERWRAIVREATEQCERLWLPELATPGAAAAWFAAPGDPAGVVVGAPGEPERGLNLLASSRGEGLPLLPDLLAETSASDGARIVRVAIGPEGGWSPAEEDGARARGWIAASAGPTILRTVTASVAAAAWLSSWRAALSSSSSPSPSP
ncbi:MAG: RsmE family RNA methyltransferase [Cyanobacteriota bacterium]